MTSVLFVCLGNICRSPMAAAVAQDMSRQSGLDWTVDSAGTGDWHRGQGADPRACAAALSVGHSLDAHRARQVQIEDFYRFDWILAMDRDNLAVLRSLAPSDGRANVGLLLDVAGMEAVVDVPDPYFGDDDGFAKVLDLLSEAVGKLAGKLR